MSKKAEKSALIIGKIEDVIKDLNRRLGKEMCKEMHSSCFSCQTRWAIGILNEWIDVLTIDINNRPTKNQVVEVLDIGWGKKKKEQPKKKNKR